MTTTTVLVLLTALVAGYEAVAAQLPSSPNWSLVAKIVGVLKVVLASASATATKAYHAVGTYLSPKPVNETNEEQPKSL